jgi:hypothetical protein
MKSHRFALFLVAACSGEQSYEWGGPYGSQAMVASPDGARAYVVDPDEDALAIVELAGDGITRIDLDGGPSRIARAGERLFVTMRDRREVRVLDPEGAVVASIPTGAEPYGIVALGDRIYVASALAAEILEIDAITMAPLRTWSTPGEPRWLAIHPSGTMLYAASARNGEAYAVDLEASDRVERIVLPRRYFRGLEGSFVRRLTGDPTVTPDGKQLMLPAIFADNTTPINDGGAAEYYGPVEANLEPAVIAVQLEAGGEPKPEVTQVLGVLAPLISGYPSSAVVSPGGDAMLVLLETAQAIVVADPRHEATVSKYRSTPDQEEATPLFEGTEHIGFEPKPMRPVTVGVGPTAAAFVGNDTALIYCFLDRKLVRVVPQEYMPEEDDLWKIREVAHAETGVELLSSSFSLHEEQGRRLFYEGVDTRVTRPGLSCALCHFGGRDDGVTWTFVKGPRQTPSLAGDIELTAPYRWQGERATIAENAIMTSRGMGRGGMSEYEASDVERFVKMIRSPDTKRRGTDGDAIRRGREIFSRPEVGCAGCHSGTAYTDNLSHYVFIEEVQTPSLTGVSATAPFFHDGSSPTLRSLLERSRSGIMGNTSSLSEEEMDDLEAFLESL